MTVDVLPGVGHDGITNADWYSYLRDQLLQQEARAAMNAKELENSLRRMEELRERSQLLAKVREVLTTVARAKREETTQRMELLVSAGLQSVLGDNSVSLRIQERQTKKQFSYGFAMSAQGYVSEDIRNEKGGGIQNLVSFLLTVVLSLMLDPTQTRFFVFDEKFAHLSRNHLDATGKLLRDLAARLGCQFLVITHSPELEEYGDVILELRKDRRGVTSAIKVK